LFISLSKILEPSAASVFVDVVQGFHCLNWMDVESTGVDKEQTNCRVFGRNHKAIVTLVIDHDPVFKSEHATVIW
jgi:hypothetical protein